MHVYLYIYICGAQVIFHEGVSYEGQLADSSAHLLALLVHVIHEFTVSSSISPIESWINALEIDTEATVMTKHARHIRLIMNLLDGERIC